METLQEFLTDRLGATLSQSAQERHEDLRIAVLARSATHGDIGPYDESSGQRYLESFRLTFDRYVADDEVTGLIREYYVIAGIGELRERTSGHLWLPDNLYGLQVTVTNDTQDEWEPYGRSISITVRAPRPEPVLA